MFEVRACSGVSSTFTVGPVAFGDFTSCEAQGFWRRSKRVVTVIMVKQHVTTDKWRPYEDGTTSKLEIGKLLLGRPGPEEPGRNFLPGKMHAWREP